MRLTQAGITHLWVDALCINQDDQEERARQIAMMGDIYSHAANVIVWLGEADEHILPNVSSNFCRHVSKIQQGCLTKSPDAPV